MGGEGIFEPHEFFSLTFPFFLRLMHKYFFGFFGVFLLLHFSFKFSLARYIFFVPRPPLSPISFLMVRPLGG